MLGPSQSVSHLCSGTLRMLPSIYFGFDLERTGNCVRTDPVFLAQRVEISAWWDVSRAAPSEEGHVQMSLAWCIDDGGLLTSEGRDVVLVTIKHSRASVHLPTPQAARPACA